MLPKKSDFKISDINQHWLRMKRLEAGVGIRLQMIKRFVRTFGNMRTFEDWRWGRKKANR